jgi:hypothetical protein
MDYGTAWECGKFHGHDFHSSPGMHGKILTLRTDIRKSGDDPDTGMNLMIGQSADFIFFTRSGLITWIMEHLTRLML